MHQSKPLALITPFSLIFLGSAILFSLRFFDTIQSYGKNLLLVRPLLSIFLIVSVFIILILREKHSAEILGLHPEKTKLALSLIFGTIAGLFFLLVYIGAYPARSFPSNVKILQFNSYLLLTVISTEILFRAWVLAALNKLMRPTSAIILSSVVYTLASLSTIGHDSTTILAGQINTFLWLELIFRSFWNGLILGLIYYKTKSIYGNILFLFISTIPEFYSIGGAVQNANDLSGLISLGGLALLLVLTAISWSRKPARIAEQPVSG